MCIKLCIINVILCHVTSCDAAPSPLLNPLPHSLGTQRVAAQGLRHIQKLVGAPTNALVENVLALLRSLYSDVQYEAAELLKVAYSIHCLNFIFVARELAEKKT